jgi:hypothetical protein
MSDILRKAYIYNVLGKRLSICRCHCLAEDIIRACTCRECVSSKRHNLLNTLQLPKFYKNIKVGGYIRLKIRSDGAKCVNLHYSDSSVFTNLQSPHLFGTYQMRVDIIRDGRRLFESKVSASGIAFLILVESTYLHGIAWSLEVTCFVVAETYERCRRLRIINNICSTIRDTAIGSRTSCSWGAGARKTGNTVIWSSSTLPIDVTARV